MKVKSVRNVETEKSDKNVLLYNLKRSEMHYNAIGYLENKANNIN